MTIVKELINLGLNKKEIDFYGTTLYVPINEITHKWKRNYEFEKNITNFIDKIDGTPYYEIPFAIGKEDKKLIKE